jgi:protein SCO1/2
MVEHSEPGPPAPRLGLLLRRRDLLVMGGLLVVLAVGLALLFRGAGAIKAPGGAAVVHSDRYVGSTVAPVLTAPPLALDNYLGTPVNIASYRGKAVLVTFLYTHCPDVCPLIASHLHTALTEMPAAERRRLQIIAVSVDPRGDTRSAVAQFLATHEMTGQMQYLIGSAPVLKAVWKGWDVADASEATAANPNLVAHSALIYGITGHGKIAVIFPANFTPAELAHDARILAAS